MGLIPQHMSNTVEHYTPAHVVEMAREVLGGIDLDPASCEAANQTVRATRYIDERDNGLIQEWRGRVFLNPPGGVLPQGISHLLGTRSSACGWWRKLMVEQATGRVSAAVFVGFTLEILRSAQGDGWPHPFDYAICVPAKRLRFGGDRPTHANVIVYTGQDVARFERVFSALGRCK